MLEQTKEILSNLQWFGALELLDQRIQEANTHGWTPTEFLTAVAMDEKLRRDSAKIKRRIRQAHFRTQASLERWDYVEDRGIKKSQIQELMSFRFLKTGQNVFINGPTGIGKTFLATAVGEYACRSGFTCTFMGITVLTEKLAMSRVDNTYLKLRERLSKQDLLIIDDIGLKKLSQDMAVDLHEILEDRQDKSTLFTTQLPLKNWGEIIDDPLTLDAIADKLKNGTLEINLRGKVTMRKKKNSDPDLDNHSVPVEIAH